MRIRDLEAGRWYACTSGIGRSPTIVSLLVSTEPHVEVRHGPRPGIVSQAEAAAEGWISMRREGARSVRHVPMIDLVPIVYLADGSPFETTWGWHLYVPGLLGGGYRQATRVRPEQMHVAAYPALRAVGQIASPMPEVLA